MNPLKRRNTGVEAFSRQFEADGDGFIYRKYGTGAAYRVTRRERDEMTDNFRRSWRWLMVVSVTVFIVFAIGFSAFDSAGSRIVFFAFGIVAVLPMGIAVKRLYAAPEIRLQHRRTLHPAMSVDERKRHFLNQLSYWQIALLPLLGLLILGWIADEVDVTKGWGRTAWLVPVSIFVLAVVQGWRKFRMSRET